MYVRRRWDPTDDAALAQHIIAYQRQTNRGCVQQVSIYYLLYVLYIAVFRMCVLLFPASSVFVLSSCCLSDPSISVRA